MQKTGKYVLNGLTIVTAILMTTNGALAQATIDGGAKPYFIVGGAMAATFFVSVGAILLRKGHRYLRFAAALRNGPQCQARWCRPTSLSGLRERNTVRARISFRKSIMSTMWMALVGMEASSKLVWMFAAIP